MHDDPSQSGLMASDVTSTGQDVVDSVASAGHPGGAIRSRTFDPANLSELERDGSDDWDEISSPERVMRTETLLAELNSQIAATADESERATLRDEAAKALSVARADYLADPILAERYYEQEASLDQ